jgi:hypothetical protein
MLTYWIPEGPCMLPSNATHQVGVGGFVINDKNEVWLLRKRKVSKLPQLTNFDKFRSPVLQHYNGLIFFKKIFGNQLQVLVVQEKFYAPSFADLWKIPTGFILEVRNFILNQGISYLWKLRMKDQPWYIISAFKSQLLNIVSVRRDLHRSCKGSQGGNWCKNLQSRT